jgi:hypothetical protein
MSDASVFYSWQSDLPNAVNRRLIGSVLEDVAKAVRRDDTIEVEPTIDRDTLGLPGAPDIGATILAKIDRASAFVADVSIVSSGNTSRPTPNPNVLIELGYAMKSLGPDRIVLVMNTAYGGPEQLPFDLRQKRVLTFSLLPDITDRKPERQKLMAALRTGLLTILGQSNPQPATGLSEIDQVRSAILIEIEQNIRLFNRFWQKMEELQAQTINRSMEEPLLRATFPAWQRTAFERNIVALNAAFTPLEVQAISTIYAHLDNLPALQADIRDAKVGYAEASQKILDLASHGISNSSIVPVFEVQKQQMNQKSGHAWIDLAQLRRAVGSAWDLLNSDATRRA